MNKFAHIYSGWFAYIAGLAQCYRGLELISGTEQVVFEQFDIGFTVSIQEWFPFTLSLDSTSWVGLAAESLVLLYLSMAEIDKYSFVANLNKIRNTRAES